MARPSTSTISNGVQGWDATLNDWRDVILQNPFPVAEVANEAALPSAAAYDRCLAATIDTNTLWWSDGTTWSPVGEWADTAERRAGYDAVNSKVIYKKSFNFTLANAGTATQAHGITGLDVGKANYMKIEGMASDGTTKRQLPWYDGTNLLEVTVNATNILIVSTKDETGSDVFVTLYYTKT